MCQAFLDSFRRRWVVNSYLSAVKLLRTQMRDIKDVEREKAERRCCCLRPPPPLTAGGFCYPGHCRCPLGDGIGVFKSEYENGEAVGTITLSAPPPPTHTRQQPQISSCRTLELEPPSTPSPITRWTRTCLTQGKGRNGSAPEQHARAPVRVVHATYSVSRSPCRPWPAA